MFTTIWHGIRRPSSYKQLIRQKTWRLTLTLLIFFTLLTVVQAVILGRAMNPFLTFMEKEFSAKMPPFRYDGARLQVDGPTPLTLTGNAGYSVIVDVSSPVPRESLNKITSGVVVGQTEFYVIDRGVQQTIPYRQLMLPPLTKDDVAETIPFLKTLMIAGLIVWSLLNIGWYFIQVTIFSIAAALLASARKVRLAYREAWLVAGLAFIPASIISFLNFFLQNGYISLAFWVAVFTYLYHGVGGFKEGNDVV